MTKSFWLFLLTLTMITALSHAQGTTQKPRTIITTDGEIDDVDSFIRMLLYANEFQIEGLVYSSSMWHYKGDGAGTKFISEMEMTRQLYGEKTDLRWPGTEWMQQLIDAYELVYPTLSTHADDFPTAEYLRSLITVGNIDFEGEMEKDTEGSNFIKAKLLDNNMEPLYLQVWGGTNTIARALKSIEDSYKGSEQWQSVYKKVCEKAILFTILDQDATYEKYISQRWPDVKVYYNANQFWCLAYPWKNAVPSEYHTYLEGGFMGAEIINNHGPLTKLYYSYGDGQKQEGDDEHMHGDLSKLKDAQWGSFDQYDFISEGDSPAFLHLIDVGLDNLANPHYGGWGGRLKQSTTNPNRWEDGADVADYNPFTEKMDETYPQTRWIKTLQLDFASRADWCVKSYEEANHPPEVTLTHPSTLMVQAGQQIELQGLAKDPDEDGLSYQWWHYKEAGTYPHTLVLKNAIQPNLSLQIPKNLSPGETIHIILEVTDTGEHPLSRYRRVVLMGE